MCAGGGKRCAQEAWGRTEEEQLLRLVLVWREEEQHTMRPRFSDEVRRRKQEAELARRR